MTFVSAKPTVAALFAAFLASSAGLAHAQEDFLARFAGSWSGSGTVQRNIDSDPTKVSCNLTGQGGGSAARVSGTCRAMAIFSRNIGIDLSYDPGSERYRGTYTGSRIGPARLSGKRSGDALNLTITWPKPVNGDTTAQMTIQNTGNGRLSVAVSDEAPGSGRRVQTTSMSLARK
jgi:hypothetical protein